MRKKVANEDRGLKEREKMHSKAAALAWLKHGKKGSASASGSIGSPKGGAIGKMPNPLMSQTTRASRHQANALSIGYGEGESVDASGGSETAITMLSVCTNRMPFCSTDASYHSSLPYTHQASRFKAEALALQSSSSSSPSSSSSASSASTAAAIVTSSISTMTTGQSLALLSLLPHQQSQKCFKKGFIGAIDATSATPWDCGSSLYDSFELLSLSNQLGRCLTTVHATAASVNPTVSSSYSKMLKSLASNPMQGPSAQPSYIPRSLYALPQLIIPNYLATTTKSTKKRSSLIHPLFSSPNAASSPACLPCPPPSSPPLHSQSSKSPPVAEDHSTRGKKATEGSGIRRVLNSLLKGLHFKEDPAVYKPKRSNLSEELEKLPKINRPPGRRGALKYEDPVSAMALNRSPNSYSASCSAEMCSKRSPTSSPSSSASAMESRRSLGSSSAAAAAGCGSSLRRAPSAHSAHFRNEGFRTTSKLPKSVKWVQPSGSS